MSSVWQRVHPTVLFALFAAVVVALVGSMLAMRACAGGNDNLRPGVAPTLQRTR